MLSSAWRVGSPKASIRQRRCGKHCCGAMTWSAKFPPSGGTPTATTTPSPDSSRSVSRWGGFLDDVAGFDPEFFGIGERKQRGRWFRSTVCCWKCRGRRWGTADLAPRVVDRPHRGACSSDCPTSNYTTSSPPTQAPSDRCTASAARPPSLASGRIAHTLGLRGPALTVEHGGLVEPARGPHGVPQSARRRKRPRPGRRLHGDAGTAHLHVDVGFGHAFADGTLPDVRCRRRRVRAFRGLRHGVAQATAGRAARR